MQINRIRTNWIQSTEAGWDGWVGDVKVCIGKMEDFSSKCGACAMQTEQIAGEPML